MVIVGDGAFLLLSAVVTAALAAILGRIGQEVSELLEDTELAASAPLTRERTQEQVVPGEGTPSRHDASAQTTNECGRVHSGTGNFLS